MIDCPLQDRLAMEDLVTSYAHAVDSMADIDAICAVFCEDAVFDLSAIGLGECCGHAGIRQFFEGAFATIRHQAHYLSNFAVTRYTGAEASIRVYVNAIAIRHDGGRINIHGRYYFDLMNDRGFWLARRHSMDILLPQTDG